MANKYIKPETKSIKVASTHQILAGSGVETGGTPGQVYTGADETYSKGFDFFMEEEEVPGKSDDEDWEDWEEEDDP